MLDEALKLLDHGDCFAAVGHLGRQEGAGAAAKAFGELMRHLYWKRKDLPRSMAVAIAGVEFCLAAAAHAEHTSPEDAAQFRGMAKALSYDIGSFTWPGWDEPGIAIGPGLQALGLEAARANLRMAAELHRGPLPMSRAHWLVGAHHLAAGDLAAALDSFDIAGNLAREAGTPNDELLCVGYRCLATALASPNDATRVAALKEVEARLDETAKDDGLGEQLRTAARVFHVGAGSAAA